MRQTEGGFSGFPAEGLRFLKSLKRNNRRDWFQPRKEIYESALKRPMTELVEAINADLAKVAPGYVTETKKAIFRIYRDTRFSHDKTPYKTHIAAVFGKRGAPGHRGGMLYFHVSPVEVEIAGGIYHPEPEELRQNLPSHLKAGAVEQIRQLVNLHLPGIRVRPLPVAPRQIPFHANKTYFVLEITAEERSQLERSGGFAFHVSGEFAGLDLKFWAIRN